MTSSSSAARADEPKTPFGLGDRRLGEVLPDAEPEWIMVELDEEDSPRGRAIGAIMGLPIGPRSLEGDTAN